MKKSYKLFFAIPFDSSIRNLYQRIQTELINEFNGVECTIGNESVGPSKDYSNFVTFKLHNRELNWQFKSQIQEADIVIADLTNNNPNVHFELGIAWVQNKNILRVTGRPVSELGFDIRNLEVYAYKNEEDLKNKIIDYLKMFFRIKQLPISKKYGNLYFRESNVLNLKALDPDKTQKMKPYDTRVIGSPKPIIMRDAGFRIKFELISANTPSDWFGLYFRAAGNPFMGSYLVYIRQDGNLEVASYHGGFSILGKKNINKKISGTHKLTIEFENNYLEVKLDNTLIELNNLSFQEPGYAAAVVYNSIADVHSLEMICRDTISWE